jgi:hypothetical protein
LSNAFGPRKPLFGPYTYRVKQNSNGDTLIGVYVGSKRIAHMDAYWAYSMRSIEGREEEVKQRGRGRSCATDLRALGAEGKYPNVLAVSHAFVTDEEHKGKGVGRAMYEAMMAEGFAVRQSRIGGQPGPMFFIPDECSGAGNTSAEARRVWDSLVRDYPSQGTSIRVDAPPVIGSRKKTNPVRRKNGAYNPLAGGSRGKSAVVQDSQTVVSADGLRRATGRNRKVSTSDWTTGRGHFDIVRSWVLKERGADGKLRVVAPDASLEYAEKFLGMTIPAHLRLNPSQHPNPRQNPKGLRWTTCEEASEFACGGDMDDVVAVAERADGAYYIVPHGNGYALLHGFDALKVGDEDVRVYTPAGWAQETQRLYRGNTLLTSKAEAEVYPTLAAAKRKAISVAAPVPFSEPPRGATYLPQQTFSFVPGHFGGGHYVKTNPNPRRRNPLRSLR